MVFPPPPSSTTQQGSMSAATFVQTLITNAHKYPVDDPHPVKLSAAVLLFCRDVIGVEHQPSVHPLWLSANAVTVSGVDCADCSAVVVKLIVDRQPFLHETDLLRRLRDAGCTDVPFVLRQSADVDPDGSPALYWFVTRRYCGTLMDVLVNEPQLITPEVAAKVVTTVGRVYALAHQIGITHCDLKPENVFMDYPPGADFCVVVGDWGSALSSDAARAAWGSSVVGTAKYLPPFASARRRTWADARADFNRLGAVMYTMAFLSEPAFHKVSGETDFDVFDIRAGFGGMFLHTMKGLCGLSTTLEQQRKLVGDFTHAIAFVSTAHGCTKDGSDAEGLVGDVVVDGSLV